jgi:hypothetical protein
MQTKRKREEKIKITEQKNKQNENKTFNNHSTQHICVVVGIGTGNQRWKELSVG